MLDQIQEQISTGQFEDTSPLAYGWKFSHRSGETNMPIFTQGKARLMQYKDGWLVGLPHYNRPVFYQGSMEEITEDVLKELLK